MTIHTHLSEAVVRAAGHDTNAMHALYERYRAGIFSFAILRCDRAEDAADLVADVFVRAMEHSDRYRARKGTPLTWLLGIASHRALELERKKRRGRGAAARLGADQCLVEQEAEAIEKAIDAHRHSSDLRHALAGLPDSERAVIELVAAFDLSPTEAARALSISQVAARVRLSRARKKLQDALPELHAMGGIL